MSGHLDPKGGDKPHLDIPAAELSSAGRVQGANQLCTRYIYIIYIYFLGIPLASASKKAAGLLLCQCIMARNKTSPATVPLPYGKCNVWNVPLVLETVNIGCCNYLVLQSIFWKVTHDWCLDKERLQGPPVVEACSRLTERLSTAVHYSVGHNMKQPFHSKPDDGFCRCSDFLSLLLSTLSFLTDTADHYIFGLDFAIRTFSFHFSSCPPSLPLHFILLPAFPVELCLLLPKQ